MLYKYKSYVGFHIYWHKCCTSSCNCHKSVHVKSLTSLTVFQWTKCYITGLTLYVNKGIINLKQVVIRKAWNSSHLATGDLRKFTSHDGWSSQFLISESIPAADVSLHLQIDSPGVSLQVKHRHSLSKAQEQVEGHWRFDTDTCSIIWNIVVSVSVSVG